MIGAIVGSAPVTAVFVAIAAALVCACVADVRRRVVPNGAVICLIVLRVMLLTLCCFGVAPLGWGAEALFWQVLAAAVVAGVLVGIAALVGAATGKTALGFGDVKLYFALLLFLDFAGMAALLAASAVIGVAWALIHALRTGEKDFPFAPSIAFGFAVALFI